MQTVVKDMVTANAEQVRTELPGIINNMQTQILSSVHKVMTESDNSHTRYMASIEENVSEHVRSMDRKFEDMNNKYDNLEKQISGTPSRSRTD